MNWLWVVLAVFVVAWFAFPSGTRGALGKTAERVEPVTQNATAHTPPVALRSAVSSSARPLSDRLASRQPEQNA